MKKLSIVVLALTSLVLVFSAVPTHVDAQPMKGFGIEIVPAPKGAPVGIRTLTSTMKFIDSEATVKNTSGKVVRAVTFGVLLRGKDADAQRPVFASKREIATNIDPGQERKLGVFGLSIADAEKKAAAFKSSSFTAECGITAVQFADGSTWKSSWPGIEASSN